MPDDTLATFRQIVQRQAGEAFVEISQRMIAQPPVVQRPPVPPTPPPAPPQPAPARATRARRAPRPAAQPQPQPAPPAPPSPLVQQRQALALLNGQAISGYDRVVWQPAGQYLVAHTTPISLVDPEGNPHDLGRFAVVLTPTEGLVTTLTVNGLDSHRERIRPYHPHVSDSSHRLCPGDQERFVSTLLDRRHYAQVLILARELLGSYNPSSAFHALTVLCPCGSRNHRRRCQSQDCQEFGCATCRLKNCSVCRMVFCDTHARPCDDCGAVLCAGCAIACQTCQCQFCPSHRQICTGCDRSRCPHCFKTCARCRSTRCPECFDDTLADTCKSCLRQALGRRKGIQLRFAFD